MNKPHIVILGAGYAGLTTATKLQKLITAGSAEITLVNKNNYHYESTWLHEVSAGTIESSHSQYDVQTVLDPNKVNFIQDTVLKIEAEEKRVVLEKQTLSYDYLIVALGFESETFGIPGLKEHAYSITNLSASEKIYQHIESRFKELKDEKLTIVVGGGGFTGIEFLGELTEKVPELCAKYSINPVQVRIFCVEAMPNILPGFDPELVTYAKDKLEKSGVVFKIGTAIKSCTENGITVEKDGVKEEIESSCVIWAAGVRGSSIIESSGFDSQRGKVKVDEFLRSPQFENVFVIGDCALVINPENERPYPPTAQISMQEAVNLAKNLSALIRGENNLTPFVYKNKGTVCSLGNHDAIGVAFGMKLKGRSASFMKKVIDNRALFIIGGFSLLLKKGKNFF